MTDRDQKRMQARQKDDATKNVLDHELDAALAKYAAVEPRAGLEERVLESLRVKRARVPDRAWWRWSVAGALATVVVMAFALAWMSGKPSHSFVVNHPSTTAQSPKEPAKQSGLKISENQTYSPEHGAIRSAAIHRSPPKVMAANPKLDKFPSPQPLSAQELALAKYVSQFPEEATLIARSQAEFEKETQQKMNDARSQAENRPDQQER